MPGKNKSTWLIPDVAAKRQAYCWAKYEKCKWEPVSHPKEEDKTYFNNPRKFAKKSQYDIYFAISRMLPLFDQRKSRENKACIADIRENIYHQECKKKVPSMTSQLYGKRPMMESVERRNNRIDQIASFYRRNGAFPIIEKQVSSNSKEIIND